MASAAPDAFISYSREDAEFVDRLEADLRARGFDVWVDRRRLEGGRDWEQEITHAMSAWSRARKIMP
jgi:TIR domain-containing protein